MIDGMKYLQREKPGNLGRVADKVQPVHFGTGQCIFDMVLDHVNQFILITA